MLWETGQVPLTYIRLTYALPQDPMSPIRRDKIENLSQRSTLMSHGVSTPLHGIALLGQALWGVIDWTIAVKTKTVTDLMARGSPRNLRPGKRGSRRVFTTALSKTGTNWGLPW